MQPKPKTGARKHRRHAGAIVGQDGKRIGLLLSGPLRSLVETQAQLRGLSEGEFVRQCIEHVDLLKLPVAPSPRTQAPYIPPPAASMLDEDGQTVHCLLRRSRWYDVAMSLITTCANTQDDIDTRTEMNRLARRIADQLKATKAAYMNMTLTPAESRWVDEAIAGIPAGDTQPDADPAEGDLQ